MSEQSPAYRHIWTPLRIGSITVKNPIVMTAMTSNYAEDHILSERHIAFYRERAKGGAGLMITEQQGAYPYTKGSFHMGCSAWDKRSIPQYAKLADAVHEHGARMFAQLAGWGVHDKGAMIMDEWHPLWAASRVPSILHHETPLFDREAPLPPKLRPRARAGSRPIRRIYKFQKVALDSCSPCNKLVRCVLDRFLGAGAVSLQRRDTVAVERLVAHKKGRTPPLAPFDPCT